MFDNVPPLKQDRSVDSLHREETIPQVQEQDTFRSILTRNSKVHNRSINSSFFKVQKVNESHLEIEQKQFQNIVGILETQPIQRTIKEMDTLQHYFGNIAFLKDFGENNGSSSLTQLIRHVTVEYFQPKEPVVTYGEQGSKFYIIVKGRLKVMVPQPREQVMTLKQIHEFITNNTNLFTEQPKVIEGNSKRSIWVRGEPMGTLISTPAKSKRNSRIQSPITPGTPKKSCLSPFSTPRWSLDQSPLSNSQEIFNGRKTLGSQITQLDSFSQRFGSPLGVLRSQTSLSPLKRMPRFVAPKRYQVQGIRDTHPDSKHKIMYTMLQEVSQVVTGDSFGELALMSSKTRAASVIALEKSYLAVIEKGTFKKVLEQYLERKNKEHMDFLSAHVFFKSLRLSRIRELYYYFTEHQFRINSHVYKESTMFKRRSPSPQMRDERPPDLSLVYFIKEGEFEVSKEMQLTSAAVQFSEEQEYVKANYSLLSSEFSRYCMLKDFIESISPSFQAKLEALQKKEKDQEKEQETVKRDVRISELFKKPSRKTKPVGRFAPAAPHVPSLNLQDPLEDQFAALQEEVAKLEADEDFLRKAFSRHVNWINQERVNINSANPFENQNYKLPLQKLVEISQTQINPLFSEQKRRLKYKTENKVLKVSVLGPGEIIGLEDALYRNGGRITTVTCKSKKGVLLAISIEELLKKLPREEIRHSVYEFAEMRLRFIEQRIYQFIELSQQQRNAQDLERRKRTTSQILYQGEMNKEIQNYKRVTGQMMRQSSFVNISKKVEEKVRMQTEKIFKIRQKPKEKNQNRNTAIQRSKGLTLPEPELSKIQNQSVAKVHREVQERLNALKESMKNRSAIVRGHRVDTGGMRQLSVGQDEIDNNDTFAIKDQMVHWPNTSTHLLRGKVKRQMKHTPSLPLIPQELYGNLTSVPLAKSIPKKISQSLHQTPRKERKLKSDVNVKSVANFRSNGSHIVMDDQMDKEPDEEDEEPGEEETPRNVLHPVGRREETDVMRITKTSKKGDDDPDKSREIQKWQNESILKKLQGQRKNAEQAKKIYFNEVLDLRRSLNMQKQGISRQDLVAHAGLRREKLNIKKLKERTHNLMFLANQRLIQQRGLRKVL